MNRFRRIAVLVLALTVVPGAVAVADTSAEEAAIRARIATWLAASQAKDAEAFAAVYAEDAVVMFEAAPDLVGREAIAAAVGGMMQDPNFSLVFEPDSVVVAASGDLAYEVGAYQLGISDPEGNAVSVAGRYVVVWKKAGDGSWKVAVDAPVSDPPAEASE